MHIILAARGGRLAAEGISSIIIQLGARDWTKSGQKQAVRWQWEPFSPTLVTRATRPSPHLFA
jgi:hypothetical protein